MKKALEELRVDFENMAKQKLFILDINKNSNQYESWPTQLLWAGYWECAKINKIVEDDDKFF